MATAETLAIRLAGSKHATRVVGRDLCDGTSDMGVCYCEECPLTGAMRRGLRGSFGVSWRLWRELYVELDLYREAGAGWN
jgi:hypothetical protein